MVQLTVAVWFHESHDVVIGRHVSESQKKSSKLQGDQYLDVPGR